MRLLVEHPILVTMNDQDEIIEDGALVVEEKWIRYAGAVSRVPVAAFDRVIDGRHMIAMPGLINAHCHSPAVLRRGLSPSRPLEIWLANQRARSGGMGEEDFYASALLGALEMLKSGTTTVLDHFPSNQAEPSAGVGETIRAMRELGLRHVVALTLADRPFEETVPLEDVAGTASFTEVRKVSQGNAQGAKRLLEACEAFIDKFHDPDRLTTCCPGPSGVQRCTDELLIGAADTAYRRHLPLHTHLAETVCQKAMGPRLYGTSLVKHLESIGVLGSNLSLAHSIWIDGQDVESIIRSGATPVHNPASNLRLGSGFAPVPQLLSQGAHVALGTDGASSNDTQNMFDAIRLATLIHNPNVPDYRLWVTPIQALRMGTREGARAFGLPTGMLAAGSLADVVLLRRDTPSFTPLNDVVCQLAHCENGSSVDTVLVDGEIVVAGGRLTRRKEEEVFRLAQESMDRLRVKMGQVTQGARNMEEALSAMYFRITRQEKTSSS